MFVTGLWLLNRGLLMIVCSNAHITRAFYAFGSIFNTVV